MKVAMGFRSSYRMFCFYILSFTLSFTMAFQSSSRLLARNTMFQTKAPKFGRSRRRRLLSPYILSTLFAENTMKEEVDPGVVEGTSLRIVKYPDPSLRAKNEEVTLEELKDGSISHLAKEMFLVMYAAEGVGLAAPQVGFNKRLMVFNESGDRKKWLEEVIMINPRIVEKSEATEVGIEGCLSFPDMDGDVERAKSVKVEALNTRGKKITKKFTGWTARIFQHEYDHLDGIVYVDRLEEEGRAKVQPRLNELIQEFGEGGAL
jgi:peptide deformylase